MVFESLPQLTIQSMIVFQVIDTPKVIETSKTEIYISIVSAALNSMFKIGTILIEASAVNETAVSYALMCAMARVGMFFMFFMFY